MPVIFEPRTPNYPLEAETPSGQQFELPFVYTDTLPPENDIKRWKFFYLPKDNPGHLPNPRRGYAINPQSLLVDDHRIILEMVRSKNPDDKITIPKEHLQSYSLEVIIPILGTVTRWYHGHFKVVI